MCLIIIIIINVEILSENNYNLFVKFRQDKINVLPALLNARHLSSINNINSIEMTV